jgi:hypothetical protein
MHPRRSLKIPSMMFDNPVAYHNPSRDPAPSQKFVTNNLVDMSGGLHGGDDGDGLKM